MLSAQGGVMNKEIIIEAVLQGEPLDQLVDMVGLLLDNPMVIIGQSFEIVSYTRNFEVENELWLNAVERGFITLEFGATLNNWDQFVVEGQEYIEFSKIDNQNKRRFYQITYQDCVIGYLNVLECNHQFDKNNAEDYQFACKVIAKELFLQKERYHPDSNVQDEDILLDLYYERFKSKEHLFHRASHLDIYHFGIYQVITSDISELISYNVETDNLKNELKGLLGDSVIIIVGHILVILLCGRTFKSEIQINKFLIQSKLEFNVSNIFTELYDFKIYFSKAREARTLKKYLTNKSRIVFYNDIKLYETLSLALEKVDYLDLVDSRIIKIQLFDLVNGTNYLETIRSYLENEKSVQAVAESLYIHRNTVIYRIKKIKELFNINFDNYDQLVQLYISTKLLMINESKKNKD